MLLPFVYNKRMSILMVLIILVCMLFTLVLTYLPIPSLIIGVEQPPNYPLIDEGRGVPLKLSKNKKKNIFLGQKTRFGKTLQDFDLTALVFVVYRWFLYRWNDRKKQTKPLGRILPDLDISRSKNEIRRDYMTI